MTENTVTIPASEYRDLKDDAYQLQCLQNAGVDNWGGYSEAMSEYFEGEDGQDEA